MIEKTFSEDLIRDQKTRTVFGFEKQNISVGKSTQKILSFSHLSLSLVLGFSGKHNSAHAVMTSSRLHFTLDKTALTCLHSKHSSTCKLHSAVAIGISCTQSLGLDFSPVTPRDALQAVRGSVCRVHARTVKEKTRTGLGGRGNYEHSGRQHDHQYHEHQSPHQL